jgi:hypothetical protein
MKAGKQSAKARKSVVDYFIWLMGCDLNLSQRRLWRMARMLTFFAQESTQSARLSAQQAVQRLTTQDSHPCQVSSPRLLFGGWIDIARQLGCDRCPVTKKFAFLDDLHYFRRNPRLQTH